MDWAASEKPRSPFPRRWADSLRRLYDRTPKVLGGIAVVGALATVTSVVALALAGMFGEDCTPDFIRLEVSFSASRFARLLGDDGPCARAVVRSFVTWDLVFPLCYGPLLCALFLWLERWRRFDREGKRREHASSHYRDLQVVAPLVAAVLDLSFENLPLAYSAHSILNHGSYGSPQTALCVSVGSIAALLKWLLLLFSSVGILVELLSGPRGEVAGRLRFSGLALLLGALPLLAVSQGQDVLQRLFEGDYPRLSVASAVASATFEAAVVWYCARKLAQIKEQDRNEDEDGNWYAFFSENVPRVWGVAVLVVIGLAFAREGLALPRCVAVGGAAYFAALLARRQPSLAPYLRKLGSVLTLWRLKGLSNVEERAGRLLLAALANCFIFWPHWLPSEEGCPTMFCARSPDEETIHLLRVASYLCIVMAWVFHLFVYYRRTIREARRRASGRAPGAGEEARNPTYDSIDIKELTPGLKFGAVCSVLASFACLAVFAAWPVPLARMLGPLWVLVIATANTVLLGSISVWVGRRFHIPVFRVALLLAVLFSLWNDNHTVRLRTESRVSLGQRPSIQDRLATWMDHEPSSNGETPVVLVAGEGGGLRAAYWTAMSLAVIQDGSPSFAPHVFAISGVSGGSLGGALFAALVRDTGRSKALPCATEELKPTTKQHSGAEYARCVSRFMEDDFLSPVMAKLLGPELLQWVLPLSISAFDRSTALEGSWEASYQAATKQPTFSEGFLELSLDEKDRSPALFLNTTHVQSGTRYIASSLVRRSGDAAAHAFLDAADVLDLVDTDMPLSTAVHNSARFTYVSPAGNLRSKSGVEHGRVVDGGYFENSGLATLREVYDVVKARPGTRPVVLYLCNDPKTCNSDLPTTDSHREPTTVADEWLSPAWALLNARVARGSLARAALRDAAGADFLQLNVCGDLKDALKNVGSATTSSEEIARARDRVVSPPLGWLLSALARDWMDASLRGSVADEHGTCSQRNAYAIGRLRDVLRAGEVNPRG